MDPGNEVVFNLDKPARVSQTDGRSVFETSHFGHHAITLKRGQNTVFWIRAVTMKNYCQFWLQLTVTAGGKTLPEPAFGDHRQPFRITASLIANPGATHPMLPIRQ